VKLLYRTAINIGFYSIIKSNESTNTYKIEYLEEIPDEMLIFNTQQTDSEVRAHLLRGISASNEKRHEM